LALKKQKNYRTIAVSWFKKLKFLLFGEMIHMKDELHNFYSAVANRYDSLEYTPKIDEFRKAEESHAIEFLRGKDSVLDIGCGTGEHLLYILREFPGIRVVGVDYTSQMIDISSNKISNKATLINADIRKISFPENHFDCMICFCTLPNINGYEEVFRKVARSVRSICISIYDIGSASEFEKFYRQNGFSPRMEDRTLVTKEGFRYNFIPKEETYKMFEESGFEVKEANYEIGTIYKGIKI